MNRKLRTPLTLVALGLLGLLGAGRALAADGEDLHGRWRGIALERGGERLPIPPEVGIMVEFKAGGVFIGTIKQKEKTERKTGTWSVKGNLLKTVVERKTEVMTYTIKKGDLRLTKPGDERSKGKPQVMLLERVK